MAETNEEIDDQATVYKVCSFGIVFSESDFEDFHTFGGKKFVALGEEM